MPSSLTLCRLPDAIAALEGDRLVEYIPGAMRSRSLVGAVYAGRVERVLPGVKAAFVDIGQEKNGFLPFSEQSDYQAHSGARPLMSGESALVQVKKDAHEDKGAFLTRDISLVGEYALLMPMNRHIGVSARVKGEGERKRLIGLGEALSQGRFGLILRHAALSARKADVEDEIEALYALSLSVLERSRCLKPPALLLPAPDPFDQLKRDYGARYELAFADEPTKEQQALISRQFAAALCRRVALPNGGTLVFDEREALSTVDVNTASFTGGASGGAALEQNLAACEEIARQIRLRNLSGIILIDFIDMASDEERGRVLASMRAALENDRVKSVAHGFTSLGLLETTRKRTREPLSGALTVSCPRCDGAGRIKEELS